MEKVILTIAIPTYNRLWKLKDTINTILEYEGDDVEVVLSDDSTNEDTKDFVEQLKDSRVIYSRRTQPGIKMIKEMIELANGQFYMVLLDKDTIIDGRSLKRFICFLREHPEINIGKCLLRFDRKVNATEFVKYISPIDSFENMAYRDWHPSGVFYKKQVLDDYINRVAEKKEVTLAVEIAAEMTLLGNGVLYQCPLIRVETEKEAARIPTVSYTDINKLFFVPQKRKEQYHRVVCHLANVKIEENIKRKNLLDVSQRFLDKATYGYRTILQNKCLCQHYCIETRDISKVELVKILLNFWAYEWKTVMKVFHFNLKNQISFEANMFLLLVKNLEASSVCVRNI